MSLDVSLWCCDFNFDQSIRFRFQVSIYVELLFAQNRTETASKKEVQGSREMYNGGNGDPTTIWDFLRRYSFFCSAEYVGKISANDF